MSVREFFFFSCSRVHNFFSVQVCLKDIVLKIHPPPKKSNGPPLKLAKITQSRYVFLANFTQIALNHPSKIASYPLAQLTSKRLGCASNPSHSRKVVF